ncbi:hypothetical protein C475_21454 [Halosimplex carlsbadense 2-9-1]|uniref:Uncharacterized protein n=1 Tax=Halosimplex carlsbadense 2-9-1 TaxID=797114 RepID=M0CC34_9EURY|nr:hypothetical protein [Halosimplex carlsbadense]ELZ19907.1 hypothetical protein C475_21454 [Halosimplex carlsbadense 2-9-1]
MTDDDQDDARDVSDGRSDSPRHPDTDDSGEAETPEAAQVSTAERVVMVLALAVTVGLFGFAAWQAYAAGSAADPSASVTGELDIDGNGTYYGVTLRNDGDAGLVSATVGVACPSPTRRVTVENVPANARRNATVRCPDGSSPSAEVVSWVPV